MEENNVIIVTESNKDIKKIGYMIMNLLSKFDNIQAIIWEEKHYISNEPTIPSNQPIIFIGETQTAKLLFDTIQWDYNELNMKYGWSGHRATLYVQKKDLSETDCKKFKELTKMQQDKIKDGTFFDKLNTISDKITKVDNRIKWVGLLLPYVWPVALFSLIKGSIDSSKIRKEQYSYLANKFVSDGLIKFLGLRND